MLLPMARETFSIRFQCREQKTNVVGEAPIEMVIIINSERTTLSLPMKASPDVFRKGTPEITEYCLEQRKRVDRALTQMLRDDTELTSSNLKDYLKRNAGMQYTIGDLFEEFLSIIEKRKGRDLTKDTYNRYVKTTKMFLEYNGIPASTPAREVNLSHFKRYQAELGRKLDPATSCNYLQKIKSIFKYGFETGRIPSNPSYGLKIDKGVKDRVLYLKQDEIQKIKEHSFSPRLQQIADVFLFACHTGLAYADIAELAPEDYKMNEYGYYYINKQRRKTGVSFTAILLEDAREIAEKYSFRLPVKSGQKTNEYLKEIGTLCGISTPLHFHMARHTAASLLINHRPAIPNETIRKIMGWTNEKQLRHYARIFNETVFSDIAETFGSNTAVFSGDKDKKGIITPQVKTECVKQAKNGQGLDSSLDDMEWFRQALGI